MFTKLIVHNFRCVGPEPVEMDLAPLTVIVGQNGTGKSTLLQALALTAQSAVEDPGRRDLVLSGERIDLRVPGEKGYRETFEDLYFRKDGRLDLSVFIETTAEPAARDEPPLPTHPPDVLKDPGPWPPRTIGYGWSRTGIQWPAFSHRFSVNGRPLLELSTSIETTNKTSASYKRSMFLGGRTGPRQSHAPGDWTDRILDERFFITNVDQLLSFASDGL